MLKTVFFGTPDFALSSFQACLRHSRLVAVVTQPDRPRGRGQQVLPCPVKAAALAAGIPCFSPASLRKPSEEREKLWALFDREKPELFAVTAYGNILPQEVLDRPSLGCVNVHASLLPRWRGAAPIQRALEAGDLRSGVCLQKMVLALDAGDVLSEAPLDLDPNIQSPELSARLAELGGELLGQLLRAPPAQLSGQAQDESKITLAAKISKEEGFWSPEWSARETHNRIRAFRAWPGVQAKLESGILFKILQTRLVPSAQIKQSPSPGLLLVDSSHVYLGCSVRAGEPNECLELELIQPANKGSVNAAAYLLNEQRKLPSGQSEIRVLRPDS